MFRQRRGNKESRALARRSQESEPGAAGQESLVSTILFRTDLTVLG